MIYELLNKADFFFENYEFQIFAGLIVVMGAAYLLRKVWKELI